MHTRLTVAVFLLFACFGFQAGAAEAGGEKLAATTRFDIPAQPLSASLRQFADQAGIQILFEEQVVRGLDAPAIKANQSAAQVLNTLLSNTGLEYTAKDRTIAVRRKTAASAPAAHTAADSMPNVSGGLQAIRIAHAETPEKVAGQSPVSTNDNKIEEIIVTAQKRQQRLQDVPSSVSVLSGEKLEALGMTQLTDYAKITPGLLLIGGGGPGTGKPALRGISGGNDRNALVGLYLDDVPFTTNSPRFQQVDAAFDPGLADIERIEVLRGPQSTLYGASTMGGLLKFVSKKPNLTDFEGSVLASGSQIDGDSGYSARLSANIPLVTDKVAARGAVFYRKDPGYVDNIFLGQKDANSNTVKGARISVLAVLGETLENTFSGFTQETVSDGSYVVFLSPTTFAPTFGRLANTTPVDEGREFSYDLLANTTVFRMPFATLTNIASYAKFASREALDFSALAGGVTGGVVPYGVNRARRTSRRYSDEIRLASQPARLEWALGLFYTDEKVVFPWNIIGIDINGAIIPPASPPVAPTSPLNLNNIDTFSTEGTYKEKAVFGNLTYHLTDRLEATVGARYSANKQTFFTDVYGRLRNFFDSHPAEDSATNYLATVSYRPTDALTLYVRAASAYRPGGPNSLNPAQLAVATQSGLGLDYKADGLWNYEVGVKGSAWNGSFTYSAAAYHMDWSDIQVNVVYTITLPNGGTSQLAATGNASKAESDGVEVAFNWLPLDGLTVGMSGAYNDAKVTANAALLLAAVGDALPYAPEWTASALVDYKTAVNGTVTANAGLTYSFTDKRRTGFTPQPLTVKLPSYGTLDLRAGLEWSRYNLTARVDNATDRYAVTFIDINASRYRGGAGNGVVLKPRTYGLSLEMRF